MLVGVVKPVLPHVQRQAKPAPAWWILAGAVALSAAALSACSDARADADAIKNLVGRETAAINGKDLHALSEIWSQDKTILLFDVPPPGRFQGWDQIGRLWKDFFDRVSDIHLAVEAVQADAEGSLGYATYDWSITGRLGDYPLQDRGQATAIYRKEDGKWRLVHAHYSPVPPALAGQEKGEAPREESASGAATPAPSQPPATAGKSPQPTPSSRGSRATPSPAPAKPKP